MTDGQCNREASNTQSEAAAIRDAHITIFAIGVTDFVELVELRGIASDPDSTHVYNVPGRKIKKESVILLCHIRKAMLFSLLTFQDIQLSVSFPPV